MKETETCQHVMICNKDEICFVQKYFTLGNETRYDFGCTYQELCQKDITGHILGKRNEHAHIACQKCCNDSNICNNDRSCRNVITRQKCLSCDHVDNPKVCNNTMTCDKGELCLHGSNTNILGRRTSAGRHLTCERCCDGTELCNTDLQCTHQEQKTTNASCRSTNECGSNLVCSSERCQCASKDDFWDNESCMRKKSNGEVCTESRQCHAPFLCIRNICSCPSTKYWNGTSCLQKGRECVDLEITTDGVYTIYPKGNDNIHRITSNGHHEISIYMEIPGGRHITANYTTFRISDEQSLYVLTVAGYNGDAGQDAIDYPNDDVKANGKPFTTKDKDNDQNSGNRANDYKSAWWYSDNFTQT
ncbi:TN [Mytilus edulis]|uniref:TN n=1 Tax=Mytilus edulis TaxID=6550 RepID=A0A8S3QUC7_MYTED|nr:TN [Mytilus edulis]